MSSSQPAAVNDAIELQWDMQEHYRRLNRLAQRKSRSARSQARSSPSALQNHGRTSKAYSEYSYRDILAWPNIGTCVVNDSPPWAMAPSSHNAQIGSDVSIPRKDAYSTAVWDTNPANQFYLDDEFVSADLTSFPASERSSTTLCDTPLTGEHDQFNLMLGEPGDTEGIHADKLAKSAEPSRRNRSSISGRQKRSSGIEYASSSSDAESARTRSDDLQYSSSYRLSHGKTILHILSEQGRESLVRLVLQSGACIDGRDSHGLTALHHAAKNGHATTVEVLLENQACGSIYDHNGLAAIHAAADNGHIETIRVMLSFGIDLNMKTQRV